jgi:hypothetical protein
MAVPDGRLSASQRDAFDRDGFVILREFADWMPIGAPAAT